MLGLWKHTRNLLFAVLTAGLFLLPETAFGQLRLRQPEIYVGFHGGLMASTVNFNPTVANMTPITNACILGGTGGFVFRYSEQRCCGLQVELNYMQRGWREHSADTEGSEEVRFSRNLHYLELPFLMHIYFGKKAWRGFVNLGPQIGYCIKDDGGSGTKQTTSVHQYASIDNPFDWGVAGGLGFYCRTKKAGLYQFEARFNYSFGTVFASKMTDYFRQSNSMNLSIHLAWLWQVKNKKQTRY